MFDLDKAITTWRRFFSKNRGITSEDLDELESHVRDQVEAYKACGIDEETAFSRAMLQMGGFTTAETEYSKVYWGKLRRRHLLADFLLLRFSMLKNYLKIAIRGLKKQKAFALINIIGLAVGMGIFTLFVLSVGTKTHADRFHDNADQLYGVVQVLQQENEEEEHSAFVPAPLLPALQDEYPEILNGVRVLPAGRMALNNGTDSFYQDHLLFVDPDFLGLFSFDLTAGDRHTALAEPYSIVLSESAVTKFFGDEHPIGRQLTVNRDVVLTVTGVTRNLPRTSSIRFEGLVSMETARSMSTSLEDWASNRFTVFLRIPDAGGWATIENNLPAFLARNYEDTADAPKRMYLFPMVDFRLHGDHITTFISTSPPASTYIILAFSVLLLLVVCVNFINMSVARHMYRTKEIGMRKVIGARRTHLITQFLGESLLIAFLAIPLAILFYELMHPFFWRYLQNISGSAYVASISNSIWNYPFLLKYIFFAAVLTGLFSGMYPAFFMSSLRPEQALKGRFGTGKNRGRGRKILIVFQFSLSILFLVAASILSRQFSHYRETDLGYSREGVAAMQITGLDHAAVELMKEEVSRQAIVTHVSRSENLPGMWESYDQAYSGEENKDIALTVESYGVGHNFVELLGLRLTRGRSFSHDRADENNFIVNEAAVHRFQWDNPVGQDLTVGERTGTVIGVAQDFLFGDIGFKTAPAILYLASEEANFLLFKYTSAEGFSGL